MEPIEITCTDDPRTAHYMSLTDRQLRCNLNPGKGVMVVESPKVIRTALKSGCTPLSLLCEEKHLHNDAADLVAMMGDRPVYTGKREVLASITGYKLTRGVLSAMRRPELPDLDTLLSRASRIAILHGVCDTTNIGSIFRSAAALGIDGLLLTRDSCDPFNRRAIRVSMGTVFQIPWTWMDDYSRLHQYGFKTVAMALRHDSMAIDDPRLQAEPRLAVVLGTEGEGLPLSVIDAMDAVVRIPMACGVDSLNVGAAAAIAFWQLSKRH